MVTGEKRIEFRKPSKWITSRLVDKNGFDKPYDVIKFTNGYGQDKPAFICEYKGWRESYSKREFEYSNGLKVKVEDGDIEIYCGKIGLKRNLRKRKNGGFNRK